MYSRTTLSLNSDKITILKDIAKKKKIKSLSGLINNIIGDFLEKYEQDQKLRKMAENYQQYAANFDHADFSKLEEGFLSDIN